MATLTSDQIHQYVWTAIWSTRGVAPSTSDLDYWINQGKFQECVDYRGLDYAISRVEGFESTGADVPPFGPYAQPPTALKSVPPYPGAQDAPGTPIPVSVGVDYGQIEKIVSQAILGAQTAILAEVDKAITAANQPLSTSFMGVKIVLHPGE